MSDNDRQLLNLIDEALERIESSGYGKCIHCGEALPEKRWKRCRGRDTVCAARTCRSAGSSATTKTRRIQHCDIITASSIR
jgi:RNA polymerase-binding transcription factor DksA